MLQDVAPCTSMTTEFMCVSEECCFACAQAFTGADACASTAK